ncbi:hypothetical protein MMC16_006213 [Acarospora aff. strigata]|nr:hypothetical protein [Acarospora aff. strigata]
MTATKPSHVDEPIARSVDESFSSTNGRHTKAEILLGTSDFGPLPMRQSKPKPTKALKEKPSFVSVSVSEISQDLAWSGDSALNSAVVGEHWGMPRLSPRGLLPRPSSPLLGRHFHASSATATERGVALSSGLHESRSSLTLRSYYDPINSPPSISQQTSASSARDMALRKGCRTITESRGYSGSQSALNLAGIGTDKHDQADDGSKKRPPRLDFSRLFSRPQPSHGPLLSPHRVTKSPLPLSVASDLPSPTPWYRREKSLKAKNSKQSSPAKNSQESPYFPFPVELPKLNIRKPKQGVEDWFDGGEGDGYLNNPASHTRLRKGASQAMDCQLPCQASSTSPASTVRKDDFPCSSQQALTSCTSGPRSSTQQFEPNVVHLCLTSPPEAGDSMYSPSSSRSKSSKKSTGSIFIHCDLQSQSILTLSSSEDEDEVEGKFSTRNGKPWSRRPSPQSNRKDIVVRQGHNTVPMTRAAASYTHSTSVVTPRSRSGPTSTRDINVSESNRSITTTFLNAPSFSHSRHMRASGSRRTESTSENVRPKTSDEVLSRSSTALVGFASTPTSPSRSDSRLQLRKSRIMAVTREEESLLEAMRHKRAMMRQGKSDQAYQRRLEEDLARASISEATARLETPELELNVADETLPVASSVFVSSPTASRRYVSSVASAFLDNASISSASCSQAAFPTNYLPTPNCSPNIHFTPSEYHSSTPPSRASPRTPPPENTSTEILMNSTGISLSLAADAMQAEAQLKLDKERSASSGPLRYIGNEEGSHTLGRT